MRDRNASPFPAFVSRVIAAAFFIILLHPGASRAAPSLRVSAAHPILPVEQSVAQKIEITLSSDGSEAGGEYKLRVSSEAGMGVLLLPGGYASQGEVSCRAGESVSVGYRWAGAIPTEQAVPEVITVSIPETGVTETVAFSIGVDLRVSEVRVPPDAESDRRSEIGLIVEDVLHPNADLPAMLENLDIAPEVRIALLREDSDAPLAPPRDAFAEKFLGRALPQRATAFPAGFQHGGLRKTPDGEKYEWIGADGETAGFAPPSGGRYRVRVSFKPGTGGIAVRDAFSPVFDVSGASAVGLGIPGFMGSTAAIIAAYAPEASAALTRDIRAALEQGQSARAASQLGAGMRGTNASSPAHILGRYLETLLKTQADVEELSSYVQHFLRGYGGHGVLIFSRSGVASWKAILPDETELSQAPQKLDETPRAQARLYVGDRLVLIPFEPGKDFMLNITGSNQGGTSLWKIIPEGVNRKTYPQGDWEKEIAVYTEKLQPPAQ